MRVVPGFPTTSRVRLKAQLRTTFAAVATYTGLAFLWHVFFAGRAVRILAYHGVETPPRSPFDVSREAFEKQIAYLVERFDVVDFATFLKWRRGEKLSKKPKIVLTFDDGFANNFEFAAPVLRKFGVPATFFIICSKLDGRDGRFMTADMASALIESNLFTIGSHSVNHVSVARLAGDRRSEEIGASKRMLEARFGREVTYFCYPYGTYNDFDKASIFALRERGYALACTSVNGVNFARTDLFRLRRTKVEWSDDIRTFSRIVGGALDGLILIDYFLRFLQKPRAVSFGGKRVPTASKT